MATQSSRWTIGWWPLALGALLACVPVVARGRPVAAGAFGGPLPGGRIGAQAPSARPAVSRLGGTVVSTRPHPAVARIVVPEKGSATSYGSGTLVDVRDRFGLVITNWHVVRDAAGTIQVIFPNGFRSAGRALKVDRNWDLAAIVIWRPDIEPVRLAPAAPRPGELLTIAGYGRGDYRAVRGRCTQYVAPGRDLPFEMVEIGCQARQGDSGGPIFNQAGELAGVLFGAGQGTTTGAYCGRVGGFLASLGPDVARPSPQQLATPRQAVPAIPVATTRPAAPPSLVPAPAVRSTPAAARPAADADRQVVTLDPPQPVTDLPSPPEVVASSRGQAAVTQLVEQAPPPRPVARPRVGTPPPLAAVAGEAGEPKQDRVAETPAHPPAASPDAPAAPSGVTGPLDQARNVLALIGGLTVLFFLSRLLVH